MLHIPASYLYWYQVLQQIICMCSFTELKCFNALHLANVLGMADLPNSMLLILLITRGTHTRSVCCVLLWTYSWALVTLHLHTLVKCEITCSVFYYFPDSFSKKWVYCSPICFTLQLLGEHTQFLLLSWHMAICGDEVSWDFSHTVTFLWKCTFLLNVTRSLLW